MILSRSSRTLVAWWRMAWARIKLSRAPKSRRSLTARGGTMSARAPAYGMVTFLVAEGLSSHHCRACQGLRSASASSSLASIESTPRVCSRVSVTVRLRRRVSFSGWSLTAVVVTMRPVGPSRSMRRGLMPFFVLSTVS
jgi:hypothetical protein